MTGAVSGPVIAFSDIEADFDWRRLWADQQVEAVRAGPGTLRLTLNEGGRLSIPGLDAGGGGSDEGASLPFDRLALRDVAIEVDGPQGDASGVLDINYDVGAGGAGTINLSTDRFLWRGMTLLNAELAADITLSGDGAATFSMKSSGDVLAAGATLRGVMLTIDGAGRSWREAVGGNLDAVAGNALISFDAPQMELRPTQSDSLMQSRQMELLFGETVQQAALAGAFDVIFDEAGVRIFFADQNPSFRLTTPNGASLALSPDSDAPLYTRAGDNETAAFAFALNSAGLQAKGAANIEQRGETWRIVAPLDVEAFVSDALSLDKSRIAIDAASNGNEISADISMESILQKAVIGRLRVTDAPFAGGFKVVADPDGQRLEVASRSDCFTIDRMRGTLEQQDLEARFGGVTLCNNAGPLAVISWMDEPSYRLSGDVSAQSGAVRFAETRAAGRPPVVNFEAVYHPRQNNTSVTGRIAGGAMVLNEALDFSRAAGRFALALDETEMALSAQLDQLRVDQHREESELLMIAPVLAAGNAALTGDNAVFSYELTTLVGRPLGAGEGVHDMRSASGETEFNLGQLTLAPEGLQPDQIFPALKGIIDAAAGGVDGVVRFGWSPEGVTSGADFAFREISFGGPTRAVTRTSGFNGALTLGSLFPVATDGLQTVTVGAVDLDALQLLDGEISFEMPGDDTLHLARGEFPWFGGSLGVYEATANLSGEAAIPLKATNVDLTKIFEYVDIEGLSGEGILSGELPLVFEGGKARIENGVMRSQGPGAVRYRGAASQQAAAAGDDAQIAFDILRDLRYNALEVSVNGALDGRLEFQMKFEGTGDVTVRNQNVANVPVIYRISLDAALLELLRQANLSRDIELQIQRGLSVEE
ncbi:MAG: YdbH domain-containing protein, partial [Pseudomonadota bacterium]